jgi:hypothetical protein
MSKGMWAGCTAVVIGTALGCWYWSDSAYLPCPNLPAKLSDSSFVANELKPVPLERYPAAHYSEVIDLSRAFDPTGQELALQTLLDDVEEPEWLLTMPRMDPLELLPAPRVFIAKMQFPEAGEEASSPPSAFDSLCAQVRAIVAHKIVQVLESMQPLKGELPNNDDDNE